MIRHKIDNNAKDRYRQMDDLDQFPGHGWVSVATDENGEPEVIQRLCLPGCMLKDVTYEMVCTVKTGSDAKPEDYETIRTTRNS